jgi:uncharacterized protein YoaH (UPF0181 family)
MEVDPMNPKKRIMKFLNDPSCDHLPGENCEVCEKVKRVRDGMSTGTATVFINKAIYEKHSGDFQFKDLANRGRYFTGRVVDYEGKTVEKLLVDKQTGIVRFI